MVLVTRLLLGNMSTSSTGYGYIYLSWEQSLPLLLACYSGGSSILPTYPKW